MRRFAQEWTGAGRIIGAHDESPFKEIGPGEDLDYFFGGVGGDGDNLGKVSDGSEAADMRCLTICMRA